MFVLYSSMTASPTATNHAMLSSSGPKVTARGCCPPATYQLHLKQNVIMSEHLIHVAQVITKESFHHNYNTAAASWGKCFATSPALVEPCLALSVNLPDPHCGFSRREHWWRWQLHLWEGAQCSDPALNLLSPQLHPSLLYTTLTINHSIICSLLFFLSISNLCVHTWDPSLLYSDPLPADLAPWGMISNCLDVCLFAPGETHPAFPHVI